MINHLIDTLVYSSQEVCQQFTLIIYACIRRDVDLGIYFLSSYLYGAWVG